MAETLQHLIVDYRDKQIEYQTDSRTARSLCYTDDGTMWVASGPVFLTERDRQVESTPIQRLEEELCAYLEEVMEFVQVNRDRTRLKRKGLN
jgi:hypothetical protein